MAMSRRFPISRSEGYSDLIFGLVTSILLHCIIFLGRNYWMQAFAPNQKPDISQSIPIEIVEVPRDRTQKPPETSRRAAKNSVAGGKVKLDKPAAVAQGAQSVKSKTPASSHENQNPSASAQAFSSDLTQPTVLQPNLPEQKLPTQSPQTADAPTDTASVPQRQQTSVLPSTTPPLPDRLRRALTPPTTPPLPEPQPPTPSTTPPETDRLRTVLKPSTTPPEPQPRAVTPPTTPPETDRLRTVLKPSTTPPEPQPRAVTPSNTPPVPNRFRTVLKPSTTPPVAKLQPQAVTPNNTPPVPNRLRTVLKPSTIPPVAKLQPRAVAPSNTPLVSKPAKLAVAPTNIQPLSKLQPRAVTPTTKSPGSSIRRQESKNRLAAKSTNSQFGTGATSRRRSPPQASPSQGHQSFKSGASRAQSHQSFTSGGASSLGPPLNVSSRNFGSHFLAALPNPNRVNEGPQGIDARQDSDDISPYLNELQEQIRKQWIPGDSQNSRTTVLHFTINRSGQLSNLEIAQHSGSEVTDEAALNAVKRAAPFAALPANYKQDAIRIQFTFNIDVIGGINYESNY